MDETERAPARHHHIVVSRHEFRLEDILPMATGARNVRHFIGLF
jgi:hypothetical protein